MLVERFGSEPASILAPAVPAIEVRALRPRSWGALGVVAVAWGTVVRIQHDDDRRYDVEHEHVSINA